MNPSAAHISSDIGNQEVNPILDRKYYIWSGLLAVKCIQAIFLPEFSSIDYVLIGYLLINMLLNLNKPLELLCLFVAGYFVDIGEWISRFAIINGATRILFLDVFFIILIVLALLDILKRPVLYPVYARWLLLLITVFWMTNFSKGILASPLGYVIGEGRFYFASIFVVIFARFFVQDHNLFFRKLSAIISLASINISFFVVLMMISGHTGEEGSRFNPGNSEVEILVFALLICFIDLHYNRNLHLIKINKIILSGIYLVIILLTGVRTMMLMAILASGYFLFISSRITNKRKLLIIGAILGLIIIFAQFEPGKKVIAEQTQYIELMQGKGKSYNKTTMDFRSAMWGAFWKQLTKSNERMLVGRAFNNEQIDIRSMEWGLTEEDQLSYVDNSLAHNDFLAISMTNGLVFSGLLLIFLFTYVFKSWTTANRDEELAPFFVLMGWILLCQIVQSATNAEIKHYGFSITLWYHVGIIAALLNIYHRRQKQKINQLGE
ncbi:MAG: hypothetical protein AAF927_03255 [Bacteroidota bacterium]